MTVIPQVKKTLKMILMVSCSYWATISPGMALWVAARQMTCNWADIDARVDKTAFVLMRCGMLTALVSPLLDPVIMFWSRKEIRNSARELLGLSSNVVHPNPQLGVDDIQL